MEFRLVLDEEKWKIFSSMEFDTPEEAIEFIIDNVPIAGDPHSGRGGSDALEPLGHSGGESRAAKHEKIRREAQKAIRRALVNNTVIPDPFTVKPRGESES